MTNTIMSYNSTINSPVLLNNQDPIQKNTRSIKSQNQIINGEPIIQQCSISKGATLLQNKSDASQLDTNLMGGAGTRRENNNPLRHDRGPTSCAPHTKPSLNIPNYQRGGRLYCGGPGVPSVIPCFYQG